jgi:hypothetical protein
LSPSGKTITLVSSRSVLCAVVMVVGPASGQVPAVPPLTPLPLCLGVGGALMVTGFLFGRGT